MKDAKFEMEIDSEPASKVKAACDGKLNGYYIEASQKAYDLLVADGYVGNSKYYNSDGKYEIIDGNFYAFTERSILTSKPLYIVNGKLSATQYGSEEVSFSASMVSDVEDSADLGFIIEDVKDEIDLFAHNVHFETYEIAKLLIDKNKKYGNSALEPKRIFSSASSVEQLLVRIDDKLSRISNQNITDDEDVISDLIGYLILLKIAQKKDL